ncbi:Protein phosphatase Slingshot homolog 3 (SSH-like protein 3) (SSH-3L) [Durusdinium trenchii]
MEVAQAWWDGLSDAERRRAEDDAGAARAELRQRIVAAGTTCEEVRSDAQKGYIFTAAVLRAADQLLKIPPPKAGGTLRGAASGDGAPLGPRCVLDGGRPGTLGLWWSDFQTASRPYELLELGITHRLNMAAEVVRKFPAADSEPRILHVPMRDAFSNEKEVNEGCVDEWAEQLGEALQILRSLRDEGARVNVSCQMGKNRSAAAILVWMCSECGWKLNTAVEHLRSITALACGNPYLIDAVGKFLQVEVDVPLNEAGDDGHWICISPPGTPRAADAAADWHVADPAANGAGGSGEVRTEEVEEVEEPLEALFEGL